MIIMAPISAGELFDKISILSIKLQRIHDANQKKNVRAELNQLTKILDALPPSDFLIVKLSFVLASLNADLWDTEDKIREHEKRGDFGETFIELARSVYRLNDQRCKIKREINELVGSEITEEKLYTV